MGTVLGRIGRVGLVFAVFVSAGVAQQAPARSAAAPARGNAVERYLDSIRDNPLLLLDFVRRLPKGGDLHAHLTGSVYAESLIGYAARDNICIDTHTLAAVARDFQPEANPP